MRLTGEQVDAYQKNGYLVVEGLVNPGEVSALQVDAVRICRGGYPCEKLPPISCCVSDEEAISRYLCIHQPHLISSTVLRMVGHPGIARVLTQIVAPNVKCMQSMLFIKPPRFPGQAWHQDEIYIPTRDRSLAGAWIALDDATVENGCLWALPGSQKNGYLYPQRPHGNPQEFDGAQESYGFDDSDEVAVECPAGSVVFFNGYLLHRSRKNGSGRFRRVLVNHYMNAYSLLPWQLQPEEAHSVGRADYRDIVMVAGEDPYAWKGVERRGKIHVRSFNAGALRGSG